MPRNRQHSKRSLKEQKQLAFNTVENMVVTGIKVEKPWTPSTYTAFKVLLSARLCAAVWSNISDCDEVFNYWEPTHFLMHKSGFQTWEYSPKYAIRSYAYLWIHAVPGMFYGTFLHSNKVLIFYSLRCLLGFCSAACEVFFYRSVCRHFGPCVARLTLVFLTVGSGLFISTTAFLPSSFSMYLMTVSFACWYLEMYELAIFATAMSTLLGWPFALILGLPIAFDIIIQKKKLFLFLKWSVLSFFLIMIPTILIDSKFFGKLVVAPFNIVMYNVFTSHGPDIYGTEPWTFYFINCFLNFNFVFPMALASVPVLIFLKRYVEGSVEKSLSPPHVLCLIPMYLWMMVFFSLSHKEERFLFPIYPLICLAGAFTVDNVQKILHGFFQKRKNLSSEPSNYVSIITCIVFCFLCISRTVVVYKGYRAPIETFMELGRLASDDTLHPLPAEYPVNVCIGKEWYRFPSSFFLPENWSLKFLKSEFRGQLPKPFSDLPNATLIVPSDMNDLNLEETSRYVDIKECDYIIDSDFSTHSELEPRYSNDENWKIMSTISFLDTQRSNRFLRAFYVPYFTDYMCNYVDYNLLQNTKIKNRLFKKKRKVFKKNEL